MKCAYTDCKTENHKNHIVKYGFYDGSQRYKCLNCNRCFIKQEDRKKKGLTEDEKHIIDQMLNENISYRAIARVLKRALSTIQKYVYSKKKLNEVLEKFEKIKFKINNLNHSEIDFIVGYAR